VEKRDGKREREDSTADNKANIFGHESIMNNREGA
jgi:hypothetical protein